jgi:hypothetical protein
MRNKSTIAKLLSEEDINVVQKQSSTASFDVKNRELVLPIWKEEMSDNVADLFVCHEIGHALYTSPDMLNSMIERKIDKSYVNIIEDARIERMVQQKYAGSRSVFLKGYKELIDKDFFGTKDKDISDMNLINRINLFYKGTSDVPFSDEEKIWVDRVANTKTEDDVLNLSEELYNWLKDKKDKEEENQEEKQEQKSQSSTDSDEGESNNQESGSDENNSDETQSSGSNDDNGDEEEENGSSQSDQDSEETNSDSEKSSNGIDAGMGSDLDATTETNYNKKQDDARDINAKDREYSFIPKVDLNKAVIPTSKIFELFNKQYSDDVNKLFLRKTTEEIQTIKQDNKKVISYMVQQFEMKKSADQYKRAATSKTGSLNMGALHSYSFNEDLFKKVTTMPNATSHGMVMFLDWSGSMADNLSSTLKQLFNLIWFCDRVKIPFEVYAFTNCYDRTNYSETNKPIQDFKSGDLIVDEVKLLNFFSSKMNKKDLDNMMVNLWRVAARYKRFRNWEEDGYPVNPPKPLYLGGTPFNHSIVVAMNLIPKYKKQIGVQKMNTVFLTDGASAPISNKFTVKDEVGETRSSINGMATMSVITDPITNTTIIPDESKKRYYYGSETQTATLLKLLKKRVPDMNILGFFVAGSGAKGLVKKDIIMQETNCSWEEATQYFKEINKNKVLVTKKDGYDEYYLLPGGAKLDVENGDLDIEAGASKANLKRAFGKVSRGKMTSRVLLNKFIEKVA